MAIRSNEERVACRICGRRLRSLSVHLGAAHGTTVLEYHERFPGAPTIGAASHALFSDAQSKRWARERESADVVQATITGTAADFKKEQKKGIGINDVELQFGSARLRILEVSPEDQKLVPEHDDYYEPDEDMTESLALALQHDIPVMLVGPTGCGKTTGVEELAAMVNWPIANGGRIDLTGDFRVADFLGEKILEVDPATGQTIVAFKDGILPQAMQKGHLMLLDEVDAAPPGILFALQSVLEPKRTLVLTADSGRLVKADPRFRIVCTANTIGKGDDTELYTGTNILNEAFLDRFGIVIQQDYLPANKEVDVIVAKTKVSESVVKLMVRVANQVRKAFKDEECFCTFSTRRLLNWAMLSDIMGIEKAAYITVLNKLKTDDKRFAHGIMQRELGGTWAKL